MDGDQLDQGRKQHTLTGTVLTIAYKCEDLLKDWLHNHYLDNLHIIDGWNGNDNAIGVYKMFKELNDQSKHDKIVKCTKLLGHIKDCSRAIVDECEQFPLSDTHRQALLLFRELNEVRDDRVMLTHFTKLEPKARRRLQVAVLRRVVLKEYKVKLTLNDCMDRVFSIKSDTKEGFLEETHKNHRRLERQDQAVKRIGSQYGGQTITIETLRSVLDSYPMAKELVGDTNAFCANYPHSFTVDGDNVTIQNVVIEDRPKTDDTNDKYLKKKFDVIRENRNKAGHANVQMITEHDVTVAQKNFDEILTESDGIFEEVYGGFWPSLAKAEWKETLTMSDLTCIFKKCMDIEKEILCADGDSELSRQKGFLRQMKMMNDWRDELIREFDKVLVPKLAIKYFQVEVKPTVVVHSKDDECWSKYSRDRLTAERFREVVKMREGTSLEKQLNSYLEAKTPTKLGKRAERYRERKQEKEGNDYLVTIDYPGLQTIQNHPELGATPDARASVALCTAPDTQPPHSIHLAIFWIVTKGLNSNGLATIPDALEAPPSFLTGHLNIGDDQELSVKEDSKYWYKAVGLLEAFPDAQGCDLVILGKEPDDVCIVAIKRNSNMHVDFQTNIVPKLERFYFGALLPELAFEDRATLYERRKEKLDDNTIDTIRDACRRVTELEE